MITGRRASLPRLFSIALFLILCAHWGAARAQSGGERAGAPDRLIVLNSARASKGKDGWKVKIAGKAPRLPEGSVIDFELRWRTHSLESFTHTLDGSRRIREEFLAKSINGFAEGLYFKAVLRLEKQDPKIQELITKRPEDFPPDRAPWAVSFGTQRFDVGTKKDLEKQRNEVRLFFKEKVRRLLKRNLDFDSGRRDALEKRRFTKGGEFDAPAWQKWVEKEVRVPVRAEQQSIRGAKKKVAFLPHLRDLKYLGEISRTVARRSYERSRSLYRELGLTVDPGDLSPEKIDVNSRSAKSSYLRKTTERLCESQGIPMSELGP